MPLNTDLKLEDVLHDPVIALIRTADRVDAASFEALLRGAACRVAAPLVGDAGPPQRALGPAAFFDFAHPARRSRAGGKSAVSLSPAISGLCGCHHAW